MALSFDKEEVVKNREKLINLVEKMKAAMDTMRRELIAEYPIGSAVGFFLNSRQKIPTWATVVGAAVEPSCLRVRLVKFGKRGKQLVRDIHFSQIVC